jgi:tetratricopeptide (TPR) repeat protein
LTQLAARANVLTAELYALQGVERWPKALETVENFEDRYESQRGLIGRVLRVRMIALDGMGQTEEASELIPRYVASDPEGAAATLQGLVDTINEEIERDRIAGRTEQAEARARTALVISEGLYDLARSKPELFDAEATYALRLQLAESALRTGDYLRAMKLFEQCYNEDAARYEGGQPRDARAIRGAAEAYYELGRYDEALPLFNSLFRGSDRGTRQWWKALLRDLQCRTELGHDPHVIIKSIRQQKFFDSQMGGAVLRREFDRLLTINERRAAAGN